MIRAWRGTGDPRVASPIIYKGQYRLALRHRGRGKAKGRRLELRPIKVGGGATSSVAPPRPIMTLPAKPLLGSLVELHKLSGWGRGTHAAL
jgi:hypothetical protein